MLRLRFVCIYTLASLSFEVSTGEFLAHFLCCVQVTVGASFLSQTISLQDSTNVKFEIWDTAGQERYAMFSDITLCFADQIFLVMLQR